jgi:hypothetical protein
LARAAAGALGGTVAADVDLLAVVDDPLDDARLKALTGAVAGEPPPGTGRPADGQTQGGGRADPAPPMEAYLELTPGSGLRVERRHPGGRDLVVEFSVCRAHGRSLVGAPPAELIGEVPPAWVWPPATPSWPTGRRSATTRRTPS